MTQTAEQPEPLIALPHPNCEAQGLLRCSDLLDTVFCGDNIEILSGFPAECVDLVVTSPPYGDLRDYGKQSPWNFEKLSYELIRVLKPGGVLVWVCADETVDGSETGVSMTQALMFKARGLRIHDTMIYQKTGIPFPESVRYNQEWEYCFVLSKGKPKTFNQLRIPTTHKRNTPAATRQKDGTMQATKYEVGKDDRLRGNVWRYNTGFMRSSPDAVTFEHPAVFPEYLAQDHISSWSNPGDLVLDPFAGSGTTLKAAKQLNRRYVGIEIHEPYISIIKNRLAQDALSLGV